MEISHIKIIESIVVVGIYIILRRTSINVINKTMTNKLIQKSRGKIVKKAINITLLFICITLISIIWGVNQSDLAAYVGSILTVVGVAFFAQWSILSNITSSIIIFFNHSVKIGDMIIIMEGKEYEIEGTVHNIGLFFVTLKTKEDEEITLPNNIFIQKLIKKKI
jgi:small-conductance mechanosensitive channel